LKSFSVFQFVEFRLFFFSRLFLTLGITLQAVIVGWQIYEITKDPLSLGLVGLFEAAPSIAVALYAGHISDRKDRKKIIVFSFAILALCSFLLLWMVDQKSLFIHYGPLPIYAVIFISGIARGFSAPASFGFQGQIVPREFYGYQAAWNSTAFQVGNVMGPLLGGLAFAWFGIEVAYTLDLILTYLALVSIVWIAKKPIPDFNQKESVRESLFAGIHFVRKNKAILSAMSLDMFAVLFGGATALLPIFAADILHVGPDGLGYLRSASSLGAVLMAGFLSFYPPVYKSGKLLLAVVFGFGLTMVGFGLSESYVFSLVCLFLSGVFDSVSVVIRSTILQVLTPESMRGRVSAVNKIFVGSSNELGAMESGITAKWMGAVQSVVFGGIMTLAVVFFADRLSPDLKDLELKDHL
jgi:MFS family permease